MAFTSKSIFTGEIIGTFLLVFIGCSSVAAAVLMGWLNLYGVAMVFGSGVTIGILASKRWSDAHLNPAVTLSLLVSRKISVSEVAPNILGQAAGALLGGLAVFLLWNGQISDFESAEGITRLSADGKRTAMIFGEFFPNPTFPNVSCSHGFACFIEGLGTFILMSIIYLLGKVPSKLEKLCPYLVGLTVTFLIIFLAPYTQGGFNPARDFFPRLVAYFNGWELHAFPEKPFSFLTVYILSPITGAAVSGILFKKY